jgi:hypothetical protein
MTLNLSRWNLHFLFLLSVFFLLFVTCRKIDRSAELTVSEKEESDFFTKHLSNDPYIQSIMGYIKRRNEKEHFVENWIEKIGYAYWDKSIKTPAPGGTIARLSTDTSTTLFIPFVIDSQVVVKTTLVVNTTPSDTNLHFIADWQYRNQPYGSIGVDTTSENVALLFMILSRGIFGYNEFQILDSNLFASMNILPGVNGRIIRFNNSPNGQAKVSTALTYTICVMTSYFCGSPNSSYCANGCDYLNCASPGTCYPLYTCTEYVIESDPDPPLPPPTGGGGPPGGGGSGGGTTPPECPPGPEAKVSTLPGCTPGWNPPGTYAFFGVLEINNDSISDPCLLAVIDSIGQTGHTSLLLKLYQTYFGNANDQYRIKYLQDTSLVDSVGNPISGRTTVGPLSNGARQVTITLNPNHLQNASKEFVSTVVLHELVHAYLTIRYPNLTKTQQHQQILNSFAGSIASSLNELFPALPLSDLYSLGLSGIDEIYLIPNGQGGYTIDPNQNAISLQKYGIGLLAARETALSYFNANLGNPC